MINEPIVDSIDKVLQSPNPYKFVVNILKFSNDIKVFVKESLAKASHVWNLKEKDIEERIITQLSQSNYHHTWLKFLQDFIIESRYWKDEIYIDSICYIKDITKTPDMIQRYHNDTLEYQITHKDLHKISFQHTKSLIKHIQNCLLDESDFSRLDKNIKKQINKLVQNYPQNKYKIKQKQDNNIKKLWKNQKTYIKYFKTQLIHKHFPEALKSIYRKVSSLNLDKKWYNKLKTHIESNWTCKEICEFKNLILQLENSIFSYVLKPILLQKLSNTISTDPHTAKRKKIRYFMLFYSSDNYQEYQALSEFLDDLEGFLSDDKSKQIHTWFSWLISSSVLVILASLFFPISILIPIITFIGSIIYKVFRNIYDNTSYQIKFNFKFNFVISITIWLGLLGTLWTENPVNQKNIYELIQTENYLASITNFSQDSEKPDDKSTHPSPDEKPPEDRSTPPPTDQPSQPPSPQTHNIKNQNFFTNQYINLGDGVYLRNLIDQILTTYKVEHNITLTEIQKDVIIKKIWEQYTTMNIHNFRQQNLNWYAWRMHRDELNRWIPNWFEIDMWQLEKIVVHNLNQLSQ